MCETCAESLCARGAWVDRASARQQPKHEKTPASYRYGWVSGADSTGRYEMRLLDNLHDTLAALHDRSYSPHRAMRFVAQKPKAREIHAADFRDRVVHHWLVPRLEALFEPIFIHDVYSNRVGKGTHKAVDRLQSFMHSVGNGGWFLQLDIANVYLNPLDQFIKHTLKCRHYLRYVDDFVLLADNPQTLLEWRGQIVNFLRAELQLELKALTEPKPVTAGADFLGYIIRPHYRLVRRRVVGSLHEKLQAFQLQMVRGNVYSGYTLSLQPEVMAQLQATLASYHGHFKHANSYRLTQTIEQTFPWLKLLHGYEPLPANITGYQSQTRFFQQHYPSADLHIQRGMEIDVIKPLLPPAPLAGGEATRLSVWEGLGMGGILRADIREYGYLKGGLKRRIVYRLVIQPGVELCPNRPKQRY